MKQLIAIAVVVVSLISIVSNAHALVSVKGYTRSNGTYVNSHVRSNPDGYKWNNLNY